MSLLITNSQDFNLTEFQSGIDSEMLWNIVAGFVVSTCLNLLTVLPTLGDELGTRKYDTVNNECRLYLTCSTVYLYNLFIVLMQVWWIYCGMPLDHLGLISFVLVLIGTGFRLWACHTLGQFYTGRIGVRMGQFVVTTGPYHWMRHPGYAGQLLVFAGALFFYNPGFKLLNIIIIAWQGYNFYQRIAKEEYMMMAYFARQYTDYAYPSRV